ncbi:uncharacterized protein [Amphiura filiformis]|uniref:uncharacterized protein n=1 Tax=Amphiura filiformis TaxID=82378 RepID=UPI003B2217DC
MEASSSYLYPSSPEESSLESEEGHSPEEINTEGGKVVTDTMLNIAQQIQALQSMVATAKKRKASGSDEPETPKKKKKRGPKKKKATPKKVATDDDGDTPKKRKRRKQSLEGYSEEQVVFRKVVYKLGRSMRQGTGWLINKFVFVKNYERDNKIYLKCQQKRNFKSCSATAVVHKGTNVAFLRYPHHTHSAPLPGEMVSGAESSDNSDKERKRVVPKG